MFNPLSIRCGEGIDKIDRRMVADKNEPGASLLAIFRSRVHATFVTYKILFDKLLSSLQTVTIESKNTRLQRSSAILYL